ncbi:hypothetical protein CYY_002659 [Polysphondylium violaceum]|uniref:WW domain-containing protein n=1 Tax=Polysphondylium violaceum TaxID=133409 RepID=A0A8J4PYG9_9MYCE|nr:hypothetical protein CYY_002659 [Polysphondylium violaceum]
MSDPFDQCEWAEATTPEGKKFYYHKVLRNSLWEKPKEYLEAEKKAALVWREYQTETGRKYYHNPITKQTRWDPPDGFVSQSSPSSSNINNNIQTNDEDNSNNNSNSNISNSINPKSSIIEESLNNSNNSMNNNNSTSLEGKEEAIVVFKKLLSDNDISSTCTFEKALRNIASDERYQALKTMGERKQVFLDYQQDRKRYEMEEKKKKRKRLEKTLSHCSKSRKK